MLLLLFISCCSIFSQQKISAATIEFEFVSKKVSGNIGGFLSASVIDTENLNASRFEGSVEVGSLKTGNFLRDWALKGRKYFDEDRHPRIHFASNAVLHEAGKIKVEGHLTMKGITKPITMYFVASQNSLSGTARLFTSDFGIHIKKKPEDNEVIVRLVFATEMKLWQRAHLIEINTFR